VIPKECKRLAEVDFPIAEVSKHADREKKIRHGHPSTLHPWWARRPLASSRAVLMALLLPDPCDRHCPDEFKKQAREVLGEVRQSPKSDEDLRKALLWFIASCSNWDMSANPTYLRVARNLVQAAHPEETPLVVDPFAGGGAIPLEALRLGCDTFASDLNPVACLILKVMLEDIPRLGRELAEELRRVGGQINAAAEKELAELYPTDSDGATPIAYLWARTVRCESPNCGAEIPLLGSLWLCKKAKRKRALRFKVLNLKGEPARVEFEIFKPTSGTEVAGGTVTRAKASCCCCGAVLPPVRVRAQLVAQKGGADVVFDERGNRIAGARLAAVVTLRPGEQGRHYRIPTDADYAAVRMAQARVAGIVAEWEAGGRRGLRPLPDELAPSTCGGFLAPPTYGASEWGLFCSSRQAVALMTFAQLLRNAVEPNRCLSLALGKLADLANVICRWEPLAECPRNVFAAGRVKPSWDFAEGVPISDSSGSWRKCVDNLIAGVISIGDLRGSATTQLAKAQDHPLPDGAAAVWFTDPPYYYSVPYADLSDFFLVWLRRALPDGALMQDPFSYDNALSPKDAQLCEMAFWDKTRFADKDAAFFEAGMAQAFAEAHRVLKEDGIGAVVFAHKTTKGWEALLSGMIRGQLTISSSWPIATEAGHRLRAQNSAALKTSVHLICRPRPEDAPVGDWDGVLRELPIRVATWIERLQSEGIRGADLVFACLGPALEIFSRYRAVETAEGREVTLPEYLEKVWEVVGRAALQQVLGSGDATAGALEEDARLTALFLWTLQSTEAPEDNGGKEEDEEEVIAKVAAKGFSLPFDVVRRFAQPMGIDLDVWTGRIIDQAKGVVRLLPVAERARALFGEEGTRAAADWIESDGGGDLQGMLFPEMKGGPPKRGRAKKAIIDADAELQAADATTLDRVHAAMLLQASGQANALRRLLKTEQDRGPDFLRLANALSALYARGSEEKRLLEAMLQAVPR
jgi:adenine-specific DNA methylase